MKILVLSLLRLGDILLHRELAKSLLQQYPQAEIDFLIHSQFSSVQALVPEVRHWHLCPRNEIQKILVEQRQSTLAAHQLLSKLITNLETEKYDLVVNATHNRFSVQMMDLIEAPKKLGIRLDNGKVVPASNSWETYLNEHFSDTNGSRFHYLDVLHHALEIKPSALNRPQSSEHKQLVLIQLLTSDEKKNWGLKRFEILFHELKNKYPQLRIFGLCSPQERVQVESLFPADGLLSPTLTELQQMLKETRLVITGDTSIQHLAASSGCETLSLFLGSADPIKTAPWSQGGWVIQGNAPCAPCKHSTPCSQKSHLCAENLSVQAVANLAEAILDGKSKPASTMKTGWRRGHYALVSQEPSGFEKRGTIEQKVWSLYLEGERSSQMSSAASAAHELAKEFSAEFRTTALREALLFHRGIGPLRETITELSSLLLNGNFSEEMFVTQLSKLNQCCGDLQKRFPQFEDSLRLLMRALSEAPQSYFAQFKNIKKGWVELETLSNLRRELLGHLGTKINSEENKHVEQ